MDRRLAPSEGLLGPRGDRDRDEDLQPHGHGPGRRALSRACAAPDRHEPLAARPRARLPLHRARLRPGRPTGGDDPRVRRARPRRQGRRDRRIQLHRGPARGGGRDQRARGPRALRVGPELVLAPRSTGRRDRLHRLPRARPRLRGVRPARRWLAHGEVPPRRRVSRRLAHGAAAEWLSPLRRRSCLRRARGARTGGGRARRVDVGARAGVAPRDTRGHRRRGRADARGAPRARTRSPRSHPLPRRAR